MDYPLQFPFPTTFFFSVLGVIDEATKRRQYTPAQNKDMVGPKIVGRNNFKIPTCHVVSFVVY